MAAIHRRIPRPRGEQQPVRSLFVQDLNRTSLVPVALPTRDLNHRNRKSHGICTRSPLREKEREGEWRERADPYRRLARTIARSGGRRHRRGNAHRRRFPRFSRDEGRIRERDTAQPTILGIRRRLCLRQETTWRCVELEFELGTLDQPLTSIAASTSTFRRRRVQPHGRRTAHDRRRDVFSSRVFSRFKSHRRRGRGRRGVRDGFAYDKTIINRN